MNDKSTVTYDTIKCEKKIREPLNMTKVLSHVMFVLHNVKIIPSNVGKKKIRKPSNVTKVQLHMMLVLFNVRMIPSNMRKKK